MISWVLWLLRLWSLSIFIPSMKNCTPVDVCTRSSWFLQCSEKICHTVRLTTWIKRKTSHLVHFADYIAGHYISIDFDVEFLESFSGFALYPGFLISQFWHICFLPSSCFSWLECLEPQRDLEVQFQPAKSKVRLKKEAENRIWSGGKACDDASKRWPKVSPLSWQTRWSRV